MYARHPSTDLSETTVWRRRPAPAPGSHQSLQVNCGVVSGGVLLGVTVGVTVGIIVAVGVPVGTGVR